MGATSAPIMCTSVRPSIELVFAPEGSSSQDILMALCRYVRGRGRGRVKDGGGMGKRKVWRRWVTREWREGECLTERGKEKFTLRG